MNADVLPSTSMIKNFKNPYSSSEASRGTWKMFGTFVVPILNRYEQEIQKLMGTSQKKSEKVSSL